MEYVSVIFCRNCHSRYVEINQWTDDKNAILHCRSCGKKEVIKNFTLGRCKVTNSELQKARDTRAVPGKFEK